LLDRPEYKNHFYINTNSKYKPQVVNRELKEITNPEQLYNGCYGRVSINFYPYNHLESGNCGIAAGLLNIQKLRDGQRISNRSSAADDFDIVEDDGILI
ncbi:MAG: ssDNA-binding protein, partial [Paraclostridium sp.]